MSIQKIKRKSKPFLVRCKDIDGNNISATFATLSEAEAFELSHKKEARMPFDFQISATERADVLKIKELCSQFGVSLGEAYSLLYRAMKERSRPVISVCDAVRAFLSYCVKKGNRPRTWKSYKNHLDNFTRWTTAMKIENVSGVSELLAQRYISQVNSQSHVKASLRAFWSYLVESGYVAENIFKTVKIAKILKDKKAIEYMSVQATIENLQAISDDFKPLYALMTFAGIRPEEIISDTGDGSKTDFLKFSDVDFKRERITIRASVAKTREARIISGIPNLFAWLKPIKEWRAIYPPTATFNKWYTAKSKLPNAIPHDALRHSFATYAYYFLGVERAVELLGHDYKTYKKHYKGLTTPEDSADYFSIMP